MTVTWKPSKFGRRIERVRVDDLADPTSTLEKLSAIDEGSIIIVYQLTGENAIYAWFETGSISIPYTVQGDGGYWTMIISGGGTVPPSIVTPTLVSTSPYVVLATDSVLYVDATAGGIITLPATTGGGRIITVKKVAHLTNTVNLDAAGADLIDGNANYVLRQLWQWVSIQDAAAGVWYVCR